GPRPDAELTTAHRSPRSRGNARSSGHGGATGTDRDLVISMLNWASARLPQGRGLPAELWARRHRGLVRLLWVQGIALTLGGLVIGGDPLHVLGDVTAIGVAIAAANSTALSMRVRSTACALGLV